MKRTLVLAAVAVSVAVGFAFGQAVKPVEKWKFPWVAEAEREKLNAPATVTELEWRCARASRHFERVRFIPAFDLRGVDVSANSDGIAVSVYLHPLNPYELDKKGSLDAATEALRNQLSSAVCGIPKDFSNCRMTVYFNSSERPLAVRSAKGWTPG
ncbi:MAG: hypothetical protein PHU85_03060 [Phycisphaerae bacterium]|nr:hypothetical protein [Phycisphaerae bacterium]